ncbi:MAG TPA: peptidase, partial [Piscirickettsiaceae bacterium]|nr:peptidase [Piscirickettsiaceae bacterium]
AQNAYIMTTLMQDVIRTGSGQRAKALQRQDIAGKTGTTNEQKDAWFTGFNPKVATSVWVGFDQPQTLGRREVGGRAALPIWIDYMRVALAQIPETPFAMPEGIVSVPIDPKTGQAVSADTPGALFEVFREPFAPQIPSEDQRALEALSNELFQ